MAASDELQIRVLIVDDEVEFATVLVRLLERRGLRAVAVHGGADALSRLKAECFDVVVLDLKMPEMDGLSTLAEARRLDPELQAIILTGHGTAASGISGMQLGAADFLRKPIDPDALCEAILAAVERARVGDGETFSAPGA